jgi:hypothetical protein
MVVVESGGTAVGKRSGKEARAMLFVALLSTRPGNTFQEGVARRLQWYYPEGANVLAEYWLETEAPRVVALVEAQSMEPFVEIEVFPVAKAEQGIGARLVPVPHQVGAHLRAPTLLHTPTYRIAWKVGLQQLAKELTHCASYQPKTKS